MLANKKNGTIYTGMTSNLTKRIHEHKMEFTEGFTKKYNVKQLVYFEQFSDPTEAITREKRLKKWKRSWKIDLIEHKNPKWNDLYRSLLPAGDQIKTCILTGWGPNTGAPQSLQPQQSYIL